MGVVDKSKDLDMWMIELQRFNNKTPLKISILEDIEKNQNYFWANDRLVCFDDPDDELAALPEEIKAQMVTNYLFKDLFDTFVYFFATGLKKDTKFLYALSQGLIPRKFDCTCQSDKVLYDEGQEVAEMYFITVGLTGFAVNQMPDKINKGYY